MKVVITEDCKFYKYDEDKYFDFELSGMRYVVVLSNGVFILKPILGLGDIENGKEHGSALKLLDGKWDY